MLAILRILLTLESKTGVYANASTHARISLQPDDSTDGFHSNIFRYLWNEYYGCSDNSFGKVWNRDNSNYPDLSDLRDKINGFSGDTGINARLSQMEAISI